MIYMFIAKGFEEIEALCPLDLMRRAGLDVTTVGIGGTHVTGAHGITVTTDIADIDFRADDMEMIFLPGGMPGTLNLAASEVVMSAIKSAIEYDSYIAAICAAPSILGDMDCSAVDRQYVTPDLRTDSSALPFPTARWCLTTIYSPQRVWERHLKWVLR